MARRDEVRRGPAGAATLGLARHGVDRQAGRGRARQGKDRQRRRGEDWPVKARRGAVRQVRLLIFSKLNEAHMSPKVQTIEKTSKSVKIWILLSTIGMIVGVFEFLACKTVPASADWLLFAMFCFAVHVGIRVVRWWING